ncbi:hypothetical protein TNCT_150071 [Trichonephila clavata]|uniref:Mif2/CENP-C cupin domain-containing protein n=1 Tax=Trichonephila clavata TaxID=2740835 RepID=A0A8X6KF94_TRICU|nr:hypothetical protein TNCT_150071 [Trichonephila clavata]
MNPQTGRLVPVQVHQPFKSLHWALPAKEERPPPYIFTEAFSSDLMSFGFLEVSPFCKKEAQYSPTYNIHFVVVKGHVEVTIQQRKFIFTVGDSCIDPFGVPYSIKNCSKFRALLSFCTFKGPFYPHQ